ncbi:G patch domain-containing protein 1 [Macroventuria anomochaeta]|uniref:G patch domain-containing protein 1 n=1 Tax=Macroventuria anomochaeta TaxID=301207 RepID=A0ACB6SEA3_9PLEO|nr:G patch domain-containing protein 1 [Macroventuria anomochaeta]KAF2632328.1 G patch domain-containing protein 1 [Macroventuria anomochaeta]
MAYKRPRATSPSNSQKRARGGLSYVSLGTELPDDKDDGEFVPVWKQTVTDDRGRRRLHGAFTGGFSAGYFNSVGSKEGWTPKTFVSSRSNRSKDQATGPTQRAEDFMDEEDLAEAAETRQLETAQNFAGIGDADDAGNDGFFGLFMKQEEAMGVKLAQKMGWRRNQGIGRKISRTARLEDGIAAGKDATSYMFAPEDTRAMPIPREKVHRKGLGYQSEARLGVEQERAADRKTSLDFEFTESSRKPLVVKKPTTKKSSFGVGVLNDTGSDDEDPYELGPKISLNKTIGKDKKAKKPSKFAKAGAGEGPVFVSKKTSTKALTLLNRASMDGRPPLAGFVLAADIAELASKPKYPPPKIPPGWKSSKSASVDAGTQGYQSVADAAKASTLDAKGRSALLGEKQLPGKSIFDFIPKDARDRLAGLSGKADLPQGRGESGPEGHLPAAEAQPKDLWSLVPALDKSTAAAALAKGATGWMPYAEDLPKRARYVGFLELRAGLKDDLPERSSSISTSDWVKELQEFAHAAQVFRPTTGIMASRFTSSSSSTLGGSTAGTTAETLVREPAKKPEDPAEQAAKMGMHGAMTRTSFPFHPSRLLCKRFNVKPPPDMPHGAEFEGDNGFKAKTEEAVSKAAMDKMLHEVLTNGPALQRPAWMGQAPQDPVPVAAPQATGHATVDVEKNEALSNERASEDVFKAIFGDDDDDDDE